MSLPAAGTVVARAAVAVTLGVLGVAAGASPAARAAVSITDVSQNCAGQNAEVEEATAAPGFFIRCGSGAAGSGMPAPPMAVPSTPLRWRCPGSGGAWDPAIAVGPTGNVYVAYMLSSGGYDYPVVSASFDQGAAVTQTTALRPLASGNWGDRDFIAVGPDGTIYVTGSTARLGSPGGGR